MGFARWVVVFVICFIFPQVDDPTANRFSSPRALREKDEHHGAPPAWPRPATRVLRAENHGNLPLEIREVRIGDQPCHACQPCHGGGFYVSGCQSLPLSLAPDEAWDVAISYFTDCVTTVEAEELLVLTSLGAFPASLRASVARPSDMGACEAARLAQVRTELRALFVDTERKRDTSSRASEGNNALLSLARGCESTPRGWKHGVFDDRSSR